ncbi:biotin--[acetyl-CoA-carboxylase] ligase [Robertmurraya sp. DFI.2.37]|uniref:biotin--[acetyl-CoA-carboxylase] ligase n=1 Tax=Robertmurraya sp. DFI.2.37 TaxID=3031819 RepID=UPI0012458868|nr:biotin--[acetyl-CoA-carboxylase] ligase [Robertmurraya sp. DFI.2.37]MDF1507748.1 biotin--[acetyl-CoA-carboxylase] ligase [Robertmurraya sp. DFI.2.37]
MQSTLRKKLLDAFTEHEGEFLSGQYLADLMGCSRTAVWKHIEDLRNEGFELEAVRRKGYRIIQKPEHVSANEIRLGLKTMLIGQQIHYKESVDSTQKVAHRLGLENALEGTVVIADEQIGGKGRMDRRWHSPKHTGIWMSVILKPQIPLPMAPQLTLLTAVAVAQAIVENTGLEPHIKWPNDLLVHGKKVTGILTELQAEADRIHSVIIGIGINVNQAVTDFPEDLRSVATSLSIEKGEHINRASLIQTIFLKLEKLYLLYLEKGFHPIKLLWESYAISIGKTITARTLTGNITGKALGINEDGVLKIEDENGVIHSIYSADIELG